MTKIRKVRTNGKESVVWEPVHELLDGVEQAVAGGWYPARRLLMDRLADAARGEAPWVPEADVEEGSKEIVVSVALPGVDRGDIRLSVSDDAVTVTGRRRVDGKEQPGRRELPRGDFRRRVRLAEEIKPASARASFRNGVLRVTLERARLHAGRHVRID